MSKNKFTHDNFSVNFILKGFTSILIGAYIYGGAYLIKSIFDGFLIDDNTMGMLSAEIIEVLVFVITFLIFLFSSFALFFSGRRAAKKYQYKLWNSTTKTAFWKYLFFILVIFASLIIITNKGFIDYLTPIFLILYGVLLFTLKDKKRKYLLILTALCVLLAVYCIVIPSYWYSSLTILGIAHISYGIVVRK